MKTKRIDLSKIDIGQVCINAAEDHMRDYQAHIKGKNSWCYLHIAETNLMQAKSYGKDTTKQYAKLRRLQQE